MRHLDEADVTDLAVAMFAAGPDKSINFILGEKTFVPDISDCIVVKKVTHNMLVAFLSQVHHFQTPGGLKYIETPSRNRLKPYTYQFASYPEPTFFMVK